MASPSPGSRPTAPSPVTGGSAHEGIAALLTAFGAAIDAGRADGVAELFTADCVFEPPTGEALRGPGAIETFYRARFADTRRRTCHQWANLRVFPDGAHRAGAEAVMTTYAFEPSVSQSHAQVRVGRVHAWCERGRDGRWRFAEHRFEMAFRLSVPLWG
ncbi:nuclear transport factor 2 family protein [Streptomyces sp. NPDC090493]|uniref:nuclear transport factor 2 family protein n=1 Tax=Streptomyces sp. NPDC090493 TaxID=3365964 RepID=UPI003806A997